MSSKRRIRRRQCTGKKRYPSLETAVHDIAVLRPAKRMNAYKCRFCGGYHLGHIPHRVSVAMAG